MTRSFTRFIGVDLGGGRGKTTAVAEVRMGPSGAEVVEVATRSERQPWTDDTLIARLANRNAPTVVAVDAPLTQPACGRCDRPVCPGMEICEEPAVIWLRTEGRALVRKAAAKTVGGGPRPTLTAQARLAPYAHRATDVVMTYERGLLPLAALTAPTGAIAARAGQLVRRLRGAGYELQRNLVEVSPPATIAALCGVRAARGYKRDADPWRTRALILEKLSDHLTFAPQSRMAREDVLQNDHCFDALISAYTAFLWARDGWTAPAGVFDEDGWIFAPPG
ncbi:MAG: DUF429 domain-containing protein [Kofleriaceae bacterium]|nr:DUF429 domain-containing protein [Kofleriaceae bacterium]